MDPYTLHRKLRTFSRIPSQQQKMFFINLFLCVKAKIAAQLLPYHKLSPHFGAHQRMLTASTLLSATQLQQALQIKRALVLAVKYTPWHLNCLTQALVAKYWCQHYQIPYMFFIGLTKSSQKPLGQEGHAWVTAGPVALSGGHSLSTHQVVLTYSNCIFSDKNKGAS